jgi:glyoxylase-like metal-dependent hydrolase (beta-lactamase superfamily II)
VKRLLAVLSLGLAFAPAAPRPLRAQVANTGDVARRGLAERDFPRARQLAPGVWSYEALRAGDPGGRMTTVSLIVVTNDGVLVADGQGNAAQTKEMVDWVARTTPQPIRYVVVASDHGDHTAGNAAFPAGVTYLATPASMRALAATTAGAPARLDTVVGRRVLRMGGTTIEVLDLGRAHTGGDLSVHLPRERVLFLSEAYLHWIFPAMRSAYPREWVETLKRAEAMDATWYVPGHGFVDDAATLKRDLPAFRRAVEQVVAEATRLHAAKVPCAGRESCEAVAAGNWGELKGWTLFGSQAPIAVRRVYDEIEGKLDPPAGAAAPRRAP